MCIFAFSLDFLEFRDPNNPQTVIYNHSVKPKTARTLCVVPPSTVFFTDPLKQYIHRLDCSGSMPTVCQSIACDYHIIDICYVKHFHENILITAPSEGLQAYSTVTGQVKWNKIDILSPGQDQKINPVRIVADGKDRLFVNDDKRCIEMFSVSDGQYLGCLIKEGEQGLGRLLGMCFVKSTSQLIVTHTKDNIPCIAILNVK